MCGGCVRALARIYSRHGTKVLGYVTAAIPALLTIEGLIPQSRQKYWLAASVLLGLLVVGRGHQNTAAAKRQE